MRLKALPDLDLKGLAAGAAGSALALLALAGTLAVKADGTQEALRGLMASKVVIIEKPGFPKDITEAHEVARPTAEPPKAPSSSPELSQDPAHEAALETPEAAPPVKLTPYPLPGLSEKTAQGLLPVIRKEDGLTPFKAYARPFKHPPTLPRIAVVVGGFGLKEDYSVQALGLPADVTLLISPYSAQPARWQQKAQEKGHELWLDLPMETNAFGSSDPGPSALSATESLESNETRLNGALAQAVGYAGIAGFYSDRYAQVNLMMQSLFGGIFGRGLGYFELNPAPPKDIAALAAKKSAPYAQGAINLGDPRFSGDNMNDAFDIAEGLALDKKLVVILAPAYPKVLEAVNNWQKSLAAKGIVLAPLSAVVNEGK